MSCPLLAEKMGDSEVEWEKSFLVDFGKALNSTKEKVNNTSQRQSSEERPETNDPAVLNSQPISSTDYSASASATPLSNLFNPTPIGQRHLCRIHRRKKGMGSLFPHYELFLEASGGQRYFLFSAQRRKTTRCSQYLISTNRADSGKFLEGVVAKVRSNFWGTEFLVYEGKARMLERGERCELAAITYDPNPMGVKGPRRMKIILPGTIGESRMKSIPYQKGNVNLLRKHEEGSLDVILLGNRPPSWSEELQSYTLNFTNRVSQPSVKNFQIVPSFDGISIDYVLLQFGRVGNDAFSMDFQFPMSAIQAFGICLSSFDPKLACE